MLKAIIKTNGVHTNTFKADAQADVDAWVLKQKFQLVPYTITRTEALKRGLDFSALDPIITDTLTGQIVSYTFPPSQTLEVSDLTAELQDEAEMEESHEAITLSNFLKSHIRKINKKKLKTGDWDNAKFMSFVSSAIIAQAERALNQASLGSYKTLAVQATEFYTTGEIAYIIGLVDAHITKWQAKGVI